MLLSQKMPYIYKFSHSTNEKLKTITAFKFDMKKKKQMWYKSIFWKCPKVTGIVMN